MLPWQPLVLGGQDRCEEVSQRVVLVEGEDVRDVLIGAAWTRLPIGKPAARCGKVGSAVIIEVAYLVATPAVKRPWAMKYRWNCAGSTPAPSASPECEARALNSRENSRSKSISSWAT